MHSIVPADYNSLTGPQKAAILILAIGDVEAGKVFALLHEDEIREVSKAMVQLGPIPAVLVERLSSEFADSVGAATGLIGGIESTERMLARSLPPDRVAQIMEEIHGPAGRTMWDKLGNVDEVMLANYLKNEYPQTVAVVLSKIRSEHAAKVLAELPEAFSTEVVMRLLRMDTRAEGRSGRRRTHFAFGVHVEPSPYCPARPARADRDDFQQPRPQDGGPLPGVA